MTVQEWLGADNKLGIDIWHKKYQYENETFDEWLDRVSSGNIELKEMIKNKEFLFGGRILANRGLQNIGKKVSFSNCYVIAPPEDNLESIFDTAKKLARTYSYGGGCGVDISKLRPRGTKVNNAAESTSGAVSFMDLYNLTTEIIGQKGRRGALMLSLDVSHPDIEEFIKIKSDLTKIQKANISVKITDNFMIAVSKGEKFDTEFKIESTGEVIKNTVDAKKLFLELAKQNWDFAEPGILFWDRISKWNLLSEDEEFEYAGTNPCAEEPLPAGGSCLLGSLVLPTFVKEGKFDKEGLRKAVRKAVKALNEVLDEGLPLHPLEEQRNSVRDWRQIGLGILGLGDMLIKLGIKYGSMEAIEFSKELGSLIIDEAIYESAMLAKEFGPYPKYKADKIFKSEFFEDNTSELTKMLVKEYGLRNSQLLTIAPTGSTATMLEMSTGIEPNFAFSYTRKTESLHGEDKFYKVFTKIAKEFMEKNGIEKEEELPDYFITAQNLNPFERIDMQSVWQQYIDASISSTINLVNETTEEEVEKLYFYAWEKGLKGMTVYRAGCKREGILTVENEPDKKEKEETPRGIMDKVPADTIYIPRDMINGCGRAKVMIGFSPSENRVTDVYYIAKGQGGCSKNIQGEAILISQVLRLGGNLKDIQKSFLGIDACSSCTLARTKGVEITGKNCPNILLKMVLDLQQEMQKDTISIPRIEKKPKENKIKIQKNIDNNMICELCGEPLTPEGGCYTCHNCGISKCD